MFARETPQYHSWTNYVLKAPGRKDAQHRSVTFWTERSLLHLQRSKNAFKELRIFESMICTFLEP